MICIPLLVLRLRLGNLAILFLLPRLLACSACFFRVFLLVGESFLQSALLFNHCLYPAIINVFLSLQPVLPLLLRLLLSLLSLLSEPLSFELSLLLSLFLGYFLRFELSLAFSLFLGLLVRVKNHFFCVFHEARASQVYHSFGIDLTLLLFLGLKLVRLYVLPLLLVFEPALLHKGVLLVLRENLWGFFLHLDRLWLGLGVGRSILFSLLFSLLADLI